MLSALSVLTITASPALASEGSLLGVGMGRDPIAIVAIRGRTYQLHVGSRFGATRVVKISDESVTLADGSTIKFAGARSSLTSPEARQPQPEMRAQVDRAPSVIVNIYQAAPSVSALSPTFTFPGYDASYFPASYYFAPSLAPANGCSITAYQPSGIPSSAGHPNGSLFAQPGALPGLFQIPKPTACS